MADIISTAEAAIILGMAPETIRSRRQRGLPVPEGQRVGRAYLYERAEVERFAAELADNAAAAGDEG
jgi:phage terminase Nu1 subunit (DNA packaging protein)